MREGDISDTEGKKAISVRKSIANAYIQYIMST